MDRRGGGDLSPQTPQRRLHARPAVGTGEEQPPPPGPNAAQTPAPERITHGTIRVAYLILRAEYVARDVTPMPCWVLGMVGIGNRRPG